MTSELALYNAELAELRATVANLDTVDEAKDLADKAAAAQTWARRVRLGEEAVNHAAEVKLRAERRAGELLAITVRPGNPQLSNEPTIGLADLGVTRDQSSEWQALAAIPEKDFDRAVEAAKAEGPLTHNGVKRHAGTLTVALSEELLERQQRETLIRGLDRAVFALEGPANHARAEAKRLLAGGDAGPLTPTRFERVVTYATAFAKELRKAGVDG